ncbi:MAG TPA: HAD-IA family hydrolase [Rhodocyclaceae bacterium]|jgi:phosphoglycolate phosphatase|nr:HAD-IA family hydrolase [Rhodocyclaceae bacterium]
MFDAVFFDLDGTLADTAPDLGGALNRVRAEENLPPLPINELRHVVSQGVRGLLRIGFGLTPDDDAYKAFYPRVLTHYEQGICNESKLFGGISELLAKLDTNKSPWGIVTNKHTRYTVPLVQALALDSRAVTVVSGDSAAKPKPAPDTLLHACKLANVNPERCWYVGDDLRDIQAARAAGMRSIAAMWGYLGDGDPPEQWQADALAYAPNDVVHLIGLE